MPRRVRRCARCPRAGPARWPGTASARRRCAAARSGRRRNCWHGSTPATWRPARRPLAAATRADRTWAPIGVAHKQRSKACASRRSTGCTDLSAPRRRRSPGTTCVRRPGNRGHPRDRGRPRRQSPPHDGRRSSTTRPAQYAPRCKPCLSAHGR
eukprot:scaffold113626_cov63-Phaeocystis_antarctica.AAC.3